MLLMIDNYDSFTYNLVQYFGELGEDVKVFRNDAITVKEIAAMNPPASCVPGPLLAAPGRHLVAAIRSSPAGFRCSVSARPPVHRPAFGGEIVHAKHLMHGKTSPVIHEGKGVFAGLPNPPDVTAYHSLAIAPRDAAACLEVTAWTGDGRDHGRAPPRIQRGRRAVPSRIDPDECAMSCSAIS